MTTNPQPVHTARCFALFFMIACSLLSGVASADRPFKFHLLERESDSTDNDGGPIPDGAVSPDGALFKDLEFADLDGDGDPDLYLFNSLGLEPPDPQFIDKLLLNDNIQGDEIQTSISFSLSDGLPNLPNGVVRRTYDGELVDLDNDDDFDVLRSDASDFESTGNGTPIQIFLNDGEGNFTDATSTTVPDLTTLRGAVRIPERLGGNAALWLDGVAYADVDGDNDLDAAFANRTNNGQDLLLLNQLTESGTFSFVPASVDFSGAAGSITHGVAFVHGGSNGPDLIITRFDGMSGPALYRNQGEDGEGVWLGYKADADFNVEAADLVVADLDGDGDEDFFAADSSTNNWVYMNDGNANFTAVSLPNSTTSGYDAIAEDLDFDGDVDIIEAPACSSNDIETSCGADTRVFLNQGGTDTNIEFIPLESPFSSTVYHRLAFAGADIDGDLDMDLVGGGYGEDGVSLYENSLFDDLDENIDLVISLDRTQSMISEELNLFRAAKNVASVMVAQRRPEDRVGLVTFDRELPGGSEELFPLSDPSVDLDETVQDIQDLPIGTCLESCTSIGTAIEAGLDTLVPDDDTNTEHVKILALLSDGKQNFDPAPEDITGMPAGVGYHTICLPGADCELLNDIASWGSSFNKSLEGDDLAQIFQNIESDATGKQIPDLTTKLSSSPTPGSGAPTVIDFDALAEPNGTVLTDQLVVTQGVRFFTDGVKTIPTLNPFPSSANARALINASLDQKILLDFQDLVPFTVFVPGSLFVTNGALVEVLDGNVLADPGPSSALAGGSGQSIELRSALARFIRPPDVPVSFAAFRYGGIGAADGELHVNGIVVPFVNPATLDGLLVGGVQITVEPSGSGNRIILDGQIDELAIRGLEAVVDDVLMQRSGSSAGTPLTIIFPTPVQAVGAEITNLTALQDEVSFAAYTPAGEFLGNTVQMPDGNSDDSSIGIEVSTANIGIVKLSYGETPTPEVLRSLSFQGAINSPTLSIASQFEVAEVDTQLRISFSWGDDDSSPIIRLLDPEGVDQFDSGDERVRITKGKIYNVIDVKAPPAGTWTIETIAPPEDAPFAAILLSTGLRMSLEPDRRVYFIDAPMTLTASLVNFEAGEINVPVTGADTEVTITKPDEEVVMLPSSAVSDLGNGDYAIAFDDVDQVGAYRVDVRMTTEVLDQNLEPVELTRARRAHVYAIERDPDDVCDDFSALFASPSIAEAGTRATVILELRDCESRDIMPDPNDPNPVYFQASAGSPIGSPIMLAPGLFEQEFILPTEAQTVDYRTFFDGKRLDPKASVIVTAGPVDPDKTRPVLLGPLPTLSAGQPSHLRVEVRPVDAYGNEREPGDIVSIDVLDESLVEFEGRVIDRGNGTYDRAMTSTMHAGETEAVVEVNGVTIAETIPIISTRACKEGDVNRDGVIDDGDIRPFVRILRGLDTDTCEADVNEDEVVNGADIVPFLRLL